MIINYAWSLVLDAMLERHAPQLSQNRTLQHKNPVS